MADTTGPGGITPGSYDPGGLSQEQRNWLYNYFGNSGEAPVGYGGQGIAGPRGDIATGVSYAQAIEPAMNTLKEAQSKIAPIYEAKSKAIEAEIAPTQQRYENLIQQIVGNQQQSVNQQTVATGRELGRRGIASESGLFDTEMTNALNPIRQYYTGQIKDVGYEQGEKVRGLQNLMMELANQQAQQEIGIQQYMAQLQSQAGMGNVEAAMQLYQLQQQQQQSALDRQLQEKLASTGQTGSYPEYKYADVLGGGYIYDPTTGEVKNTLKDLKGVVTNSNSGW